LRACRRFSCLYREPPGDHQTANAMALVNAGGAVMIPDSELDGPRLMAAVDSLLADPAQLHKMSLAAARSARRDAASAVADLVVQHSRSPIPPSSEAHNDS